MNPQMMAQALMRQQSYGALQNGATQQPDLNGSMAMPLSSPELGAAPASPPVAAAPPMPMPPDMPPQTMQPPGPPIPMNGGMAAPGMGMMPLSKAPARRPF